MSEIAQLACNETGDVDEQLDRAEQPLLEIRGNRGQSVVELLSPLISRYHEVQASYDHRDELLGVPTDLTNLDPLLDGLQTPDLVPAAGRLASGKTGFLLNTALNASRRLHQRAAVFSLEMSKSQIVEQLVAQESGINSHKLRTGELADDAGLAVWESNALRLVQLPDHFKAFGAVNQVLDVYHDLILPAISPFARLAIVGSCVSRLLEFG